VKPLVYCILCLSRFRLLWYLWQSAAALFLFRYYWFTQVIFQSMVWYY